MKIFLKHSKNFKIYKCIHKTERKKGSIEPNPVKVLNYYSRKSDWATESRSSSSFAYCSGILFICMYLSRSSSLLDANRIDSDGAERWRLAQK